MSHHWSAFCTAELRPWRMLWRIFSGDRSRRERRDFIQSLRSRRRSSSRCTITWRGRK